jgi:hypothetical protein
MSDERMTRSEWARQTAAHRKQISGTCAICGKEFTGTKRRMYCSQRCAMAAYRNKHREEINAKQAEYYQLSKARAESPTA